MKQIKSYLYKVALRFISKRIINGDQLTPDYLIKKGWVIEFDPATEKKFYVESNVKDRDKVWIEFEHHYYRIWHGREKVFIGLESSIQWLQTHLLVLNKYEAIQL